MTDDPPPRLLSFTDLAEISDPHARIKGQLRMLDALLATAVREKDFAAALKIQEAAARLLQRLR